jgi:hypothetical protein
MHLVAAGASFFLQPDVSQLEPSPELKKLRAGGNQANSPESAERDAGRYPEGIVSRCCPDEPGVRAQLLGSPPMELRFRKCVSCEV